MEIAVNRAASGAQLLGAYSRFEWNHPGPILYYCLLPFYQLLGGGTAGLLFGAALLCCGCAAAAVLVARQWLGVAGAVVAAALLVLLLFHATAPRVTFSYWNPCIVMLPFFLLLLLSAALVSGKRTAMPAVIVLGCFLTQTSVSCAPTSLAIIGIALVWSALRTWRAGRAEWLAWLKTGAVSMLCGLVLWLPPLIEEAGSGPGNLTGLWNFFTRDAAGQSLHDVLDLATRELASLPMLVFDLVAGDSQTPRLACRVLATVQTVLLAGAVVAAWRRRQGWIVRLGVLTLVAIVVSVVALLRVRGVLGDHLVFWVPMLGVSSWLCIVIAAMPGCDRFAAARTMRGKALACAVVLTVLAITVVLPVRSALAKPPIRLIHREMVNRLSEQVLQKVRAGEIHAPTLRMLKHWEVGAGVALQLLRRDIAFDIEEYRLHMFGRWLVPRAAAGDELLFCDRSLSQKIGSDPNQHLIAEAGRVVVFHYCDHRRLRPVSVVKFGAQCQPYLRAGFTSDWEFHRARGASERWGTDRVMRLMLPLAPRAPHRMRLRCRPRSVAGRKQRLEVVFNGRPICELTLADGVKTYAMSIPAAAVRRRNRVELRAAYATGAGRDPLTGEVRKRSVAFEWIEIEAIE